MKTGWADSTRNRMDEERGEAPGREGKGAESIDGKLQGGEERGCGGGNPMRGRGKGEMKGLAASARGWAARVARRSDNRLQSRN